MATLADTNLELQARLRAAVAAAVGEIWTRLPGHDRANVPQWLTAVLPIVEAAQRQSVALTDAYVARALERPPIGLEATALIGQAVRAGSPPATVYTRPFIQTWAALGNGTDYQTAVAEGLHRAQSTARMDVQLSHFATYGELQTVDPTIRGYQRVADASACTFCRLVNGAFVKSATASPLHNGCGCGLRPILHDVDPTPLPAGVAVHDHGELGPVLTDPTHHFQSVSDF